MSEEDGDIGGGRDLRQIEQRTTGWLGRAIRLVLFLLPLMYVAAILAAVVHEVLGHGLSAVLLGGSFDGFRVGWAGGGEAFAIVWPWAPQGHMIFHLASGIIATTVCGVAFLALVPLFRRRLAVQLALLIAAFIFLGSGTSYILWNSYHPVPPGDIGTIIELCCGDQSPEASALRWVLLIAGVVLSAGTLLYFYRAIFIRLETFIVDGGRLTGRSRLLVLFLFLVPPPAILCVTSDWNRTFPGIGHLPNIAGVTSIAAVVALLFWYRPRLRPQGPIPPITWRHMAVSWTCLVATITPVALWLNDGVRWRQEGDAWIRALFAGEGPRIMGPFMISASGNFALCWVDNNDPLNPHPYVVSLREGDFEPTLLEFPGVDWYTGATWKAGPGCNDLIYVNGGQLACIRTLRVSSAGITQVSSYPQDPNLRLSLVSDCDSPSGPVFALRVRNRPRSASSGGCLGFSKDDGATITMSTIPIPWPTQICWVDDDTFYMATGREQDTVVSRVDLNIEAMTWQVSDTETQAGAVLATHGLHGSPVYAVGNRLFLGDKLFCFLPEVVKRPVVDGDRLACFSRSGGTVYVLNDTGQVIDTVSTPVEANFCVLSAANQCLYWTSSDNRKVYSYNYVTKKQAVIFDVNEVL